MTVDKLKLLKPLFQCFFAIHRDVQGIFKQRVRHREYSLRQSGY